MNKGLTIGVIVAIIIAIGAGVYATQRGDTGTQNQNGNGNTAAGTLEYRSNELGLAFKYPDTYQVQLQHTETGHVVVLMDKTAAANIPQNGEGPPAITVSEFSNAQGTSLENWIRNTPQSNFQISTDKVLTPGSVGDRNALAYQHSGLYESDAVAVDADNRIFLFAAGWMSADDQIRKDFENLLSTVSFFTPTEDDQH